MTPGVHVRILAEGSGSGPVCILVKRSDGGLENGKFFVVSNGCEYIAPGRVTAEKIMFTVSLIASIEADR